MAKIAVYYDQYDADTQLHPCWMVIRFRAGAFDWERNAFYAPVECPFQRHRAEDFQTDEMAVSVELADLLVHPEKAGYFGMNIPRIKHRIKTLGADPDDVRLFIIQICDIEDVLQMDVSDFFDWRRSA